MKAIARSFMWWPGMDTAIEELAKACAFCKAVKGAPSVSPFHPWRRPDVPWQRVHVDFAGPFRRFFAASGCTLGSGQKLLNSHPPQLTLPLPSSDVSLQHTAYLNSLCSTMVPSLCAMGLLIPFEPIESSISVQLPTIHLLTGLWNNWYRRSSSR